jgi:hypothetical protein
MNEKNSLETKMDQDKKLVVNLVQTLDESLDDIDELSLQRLKNARLKALNYSAKSTRKWVPLSVAASVAALLLIPVAIHQYSANSVGEQDVEIVSQDVPYSAEEMDDIEMLMALEGGDA